MYSNFVFKHTIDVICSQVQKIDIGYAKTAKKMDVKKLKGAMWRLLTDNGEGNKVCWYASWQHLAYQKLLYKFCHKLLHM